MQNLGNKPQTRIRSYIRRQGRITPSQQSALNKFSDKYCLDHELNLQDVNFLESKAPLFLEIGFGNGESLVEMAVRNPHQNYIGIDVHKPGVGHLLLQLEQRNIRNVRICCHDAIEVLERLITNNSLSGIYLFFPDPWPKKRHHKRRIVRSEFIKLISSKLKPAGFFHAATDWEHYAHGMLTMLNQATELSNTNTDNSFCPRPEDRPLTKFEKRGIRLGHGVWDLVFSKK